MAKLIINPTSGARKEIPIAEKVLSIGRDPSNDLVLSDGMVSRRHAIMELKDDEYVLRDNNSSNGTLVNGDRVESDQTLRDGDLIAIGSARLLYQAGEGELSPKEPARPLLATKPLDASALRSGGTNCSSCGLAANPSDTYCRKCGHEIAVSAERRVVCNHCGSSVPSPAEFCSKCGKTLLKDSDQYHLRTKLQPFDPAVLNAKPPGSSGKSTKTDPRTAVSPDSSEGLRRSGQKEPSAARPSAIKEAPAGFWIRLVAYLIDSFLIGLPMMIGGGISVALNFERGAVPGSTGVSPATIGFAVAGVILTALLVIIYPVYFWVVRGSTPGKRLLGLTLVRASGESPIGMRCALLRLVGYFINGFTFGIGFLLIACSEDKRGLHDRLAETREVRRR